MSDAVTIEEQTIKTCPLCFCGFFQKHTNPDFDVVMCGGCGNIGLFETFWVDESGDMLFKLVSDVRKKPPR